MTDAAEQFVQHLTESQSRLFGYVYSLLGDRSRAADVVQETNLVLWRKIEEFDPSRPFLPWAFAIARFQVMAHLRDRKRDRVLLDESLAEKLSSEVEQQMQTLSAAGEALRPCMQRLKAHHRDLIQQRYFQALPLAEIATQEGKPVGAMKMAIMRIRKRLAECIQQQIAAEG